MYFLDLLFILPITCVLDTIKKLNIQKILKFKYEGKNEKKRNILCAI